jgi:thiol-disulfide isomerase/thioredoxin
VARINDDGRLAPRMNTSGLVARVKGLYLSLFKGVEKTVGEDRDVENMEHGNSDGSSFSGNERDHLYLSDGGKEFHDLSGVSGLDSPSDGRSMVIWDFDRDGRPDFGLTNANYPHLQIYRNAVPEDGRAMLAFRFVGGNTTPAPKDSWSPRDAYGARVSLDLGDLRLERSLAAGEGLGAQNSSTLLVGIGRRPGAKAVRVTWPSGRVQELGEVQAGMLVTAYEDATQGPNGSAFTAEPYRRKLAAAPQVHQAKTPKVLSLPHTGPAPQLRMYTTMATWCESCRKEIPHLQRLRSEFGESVLGMYGVPIDPEDTEEGLKAWMSEHKPPYELLSEIGEAKRTAVRDMVLAELKQEAVPATILTGPDGRVLAAQWGPPTVSKIRELLRSSASGGAK